MFNLASPPTPAPAITFPLAGNGRIYQLAAAPRQSHSIVVVFVDVVVVLLLRINFEARRLNCRSLGHRIDVWGPGVCTGGLHAIPQHRLGNQRIGHARSINERGPTPLAARGNCVLINFLRRRAPPFFAPRAVGYLYVRTYVHTYGTSLLPRHRVGGSGNIHGSISRSFYGQRTRAFAITHSPALLHPLRRLG
jgi:hypothetical protein